VVADVAADVYWHVVADVDRHVAADAVVTWPVPSDVHVSVFIGPHGIL
jgi:hypothetical protein